MPNTTKPSQLDGVNDEITGYRFQTDDLCVGDRMPGVSAFMRIRNGAEFLEATIRSHIHFYDEIVAVYNQCTDETPEILSRLQQEYGSQRLRLIHYTDRVYPQGSSGHATTDPGSEHSLVNYCNCALAATRYQYATKLDDDHVAIALTTQALCDAIRTGEINDQKMYSFSGLNLFRSAEGELKILARDPISGSGDIGFFRVSKETYFYHDQRFERFRRVGLRRVFAGFLYWHLKYLKDQFGFANCELSDNPQSRYVKHQAALQDQSVQLWDLQQLAAAKQPSRWQALIGLLSEKFDFIRNRDAGISAAFPEASVLDAFERTAGPNMMVHGSVRRLLSPVADECVTSATVDAFAA